MLASFFLKKETVQKLKVSFDVVFTLHIPWLALQMVKIAAPLPQILQTREERRATTEQISG